MGFFAGFSQVIDKGLEVGVGLLIGSAWKIGNFPD